VIEFHELARQGVREATEWHRKLSQQVATRFVVQVEQAIERLTSDPESYPLITESHRYVPVSGFPYILAFNCPSLATVRVVAVAHTRRRSRYCGD
jgi:toxin ParE1/3/4